MYGCTYTRNICFMLFAIPNRLLHAYINYFIKGDCTASVIVKLNQKKKHIIIIIQYFTLQLHRKPIRVYKRLIVSLRLRLMLLTHSETKDSSLHNIQARHLKLHMMNRKQPLSATQCILSTYISFCSVTPLLP